jgi:acid phosphatase type 7
VISVVLLLVALVACAQQSGQTAGGQSSPTSQQQPASSAQQQSSSPNAQEPAQQPPSSAEPQSQQAQVPPPNPASIGTFDITTESPGNRFTFIGYGDTRFMDPNDTRHSNATARAALVQRMAKDKPFFIAMTGDVVYEGANVEEWLQYDRETKVWRDQKIKVFPALGNHDVRGSDAAAMANYFQRYPLIDSKRWYSVRVANVALFVLDSTEENRPWQQQANWLEANLSALPDGIDFVVVTMHHPPYTESTTHMLGGGHEARKQERQLAEMMEAHQAKMRAKILVVTGHVHNYERYEHGGVMYIVSGGGGATPYIIRRNAGDFYTEEGPTYHYCRFQVNGSHVKFEMVKYIDPNNFQVKDTFELDAK